MRTHLENILPEIIKIRHQIHQFPELRYEEHQTAKLVADILKSYGYTPETNIAKTGVVAILDSGKPGKTVGLRADMDALPLTEETNVPYISKHPGRMHACGHDGHTATLLAVANVLRHFKNDFSGKIKFIFQPAEEGGNGADAMIKAGVLENPKVDFIFGYHNIPTFPKNKIILRPGCILAGAAVFQINIVGKGGHSSTPEKVIDPVLIGSVIVQNLQNIISRMISPFDTAVISVTQFHAGTADNVISGDAILRGTFRFTSDETFKLIQNKMQTIVEKTAQSFGGTATIEWVSTTPATINHIKETAHVKETVIKLFGEENVMSLENNLMATEDFSFFLNKIPGCYFLVGTGTDKNYVHHPKYIFEDEIIPIAAETLAMVALNTLRN